MRTKAAILFQINKPLVIEEIEIPKLKTGQVLVKMMASGICRGQLNEVMGWKGQDKHLPHLLGHEGAGMVLEIGKEVTKVRKGDHVVLTWIKSEGLEGGAVQYTKGDKVINSGPIATFSELAVISENRLVKIEKDIPFEFASLLGCAIPTGTGIMVNTLKNYSGDSITIFGCGGVGGGVLLGAKLRKLITIIAVDINPQALTFAKKLGATHTILFEENSIINHIRSVCPQGSDFSVEATGNKLAMEKAIGSVKDNGTVVIAGNIKTGEKIAIDPFDLIKGKILLGTWGGEAKPDRDIPYYIASFQKGLLPLDVLVSRKFPLEEINVALTLLEKHGSFGRMIIELEK